VHVIVELLAQPKLYGIIEELIDVFGRATGFSHLSSKSA